MIYLFVAFIVSLVLASFFGHVVHWALHQPWTGIAHKGHMQHHEVFYPPGRMVSDSYQAPPWYHNSSLLFTPPLLALVGIVGTVLWLCGAPMVGLAVFAAAMVSFALINDAVHDSFHLRKQPLARFGWYRRLRKLHYVHHRNMTVNFGVINFTWDQVFRTKANHR